MERIQHAVRDDWERRVAEKGLIYNRLSDGRPYWNESAHYEFTSAEIDRLEATTNELHALCLAAAQNIIDNKRYSQLGIAESAVPLIEWAWIAEPPALYGRFDLAFDGTGPAKMLEYNADTPTALLEAAVIQWYWLEDVAKSADQFNSLHERLVAKWRDLDPYLDGRPVYFSHMRDDSGEDMMTVLYLIDTANEAGLSAQPILVRDIGWDGASFVDLDSNPIVSIFKLYPWEWMVREQFGPQLFSVYKRMQWIEPIWKMLLSNKGILAVLWELNPGHPNLLPAYFEKPAEWDTYIKKPMLSREGANITIVKDGISMEKTAGHYGGESFVYQALANMRTFNGHYPVIGSWMIDQEAGGMGVRESETTITNNLSCFVPHLFK